MAGSGCRALSAVQIPGPKGPLEGTLTGPPEAHDLVLILPGSGPTDRDGNGPAGGVQTNTYKLLAEGLAAAGIASLRVDKRGLFGSAAALSDPNAVTLGDYVLDACDWLAHRAPFHARLWIAGHSEGGVVALRAAASREAPQGLNGLILLATPGRPLDAVLRGQLADHPMAAQADRALEALGRGAPAPTLEPPLDTLFAPSLTRFWQDALAHPPATLAAGWPGPALIVQGDRDVQVGPGDADLLQGALRGAQRLDLIGGTHMLKRDVPGDPMATYRDPTVPLHPDVVPGIVRYMAAARACS